MLWVVNDRGGEDGLVAMGDDGRDLGVVSVDGVDHHDWEDVAVGSGPDPDVSYLYIADIGNNEGRRSTLSVIRLPEPKVAPNGYPKALGGAETLRFRYPEGNPDAEALIVDPRTGELFVITKVLTGDASVYRLDPDAFGGPVVNAVQVATVTIQLPDDLDERPGTQITGADLAPDSSAVLLRTYDAVRAFPVPDGGTLVDALRGRSCVGPAVAERSGESIAFAADGSSYLTMPEISAAIEAGRLPPDASPSLHTVRVDPPAGAATAGQVASGENNDAKKRAVLLLALGGLAAVVVLWVLVRSLVRARRRR